MAGIAFDASSSGEITNTSLTVAHTCTGNDRLLVASLLSGTADISPTATYAGNAMTLLTKVANTGPAAEIYYFYQLAPATGNNNIVITAGASEYLGVAAASYTGVKNQAPEASGSSADSTSPVSKAISTLSTGAWIISTAGNGDSVFTVTSSGDTKRKELAGGNDVAIFDSNGAIAPVGSHTTSATFTGGRNAGLICAAWAPAVTLGNALGYFDV